MKLELNIEKRYVVVIVAVLLVVGGGLIFVVAQPNGSPDPGHLLDCYVKTVSGTSINLQASCLPNYQVTGCAARCSGSSEDQDVSFSGNGCHLNDGGSSNACPSNNNRHIQAMCCRVRS